MRLIDADALIEAMKKTESEYENAMTCPSWWSAFNVISEQPTTYDIDKVVVELEKSSKLVNETNEYCDDDGNDYIPLSTAIEIVNQGGVSDDVCEWKQTSTAKYKTSCGYRLEEYFDTNACYCKQCGKKIKVVG